MLSFDDARLLLLADVPQLSVERVALADAAGRVAARDLVAPSPLPRFDYSAMDGYALSVASLAGAGPPFVLPVAGESRAGAAAAALARSSACRIFTGAPIPAGADAVVMQEAVRRDAHAVRFDIPPRVGEHIRRAGEDLALGAVAFAAGTRLTAGSIALAAMLGCAEVSVARRPCVTILCTGDELRAPGEALEGACIPESNSAPLAAMARRAGALVRVAPIARDEPRELAHAIAAALDGTDVLVTVGGVSVGDADFVRAALEAAGVALEFWKVAIKPGKPLAVGSSPRARVLGLPGNPASALVTFTLFGMPLLRALQGDRAPIPLLVPVRLAAGRKRSPDRLEFVRGALRRGPDALELEAHDNQASGAATNLAQSDGLAFVPPGPAPLVPGAQLDFLRWSDA